VSAIISADGRYRYRLGRRWADGPAVLWIMLNPSTADAEQDDPTIRRCIAFSKQFHYGALWVGNLYAFRSTDPDALWGLGASAARGPENASHLSAMGAECQQIIAAWGVSGGRGVPLAIAEAGLDGRKLTCIGKTMRADTGKPSGAAGKWQR
jgi:hypothetical protein